MLVVTFGISWFNARNVGRIWSEVKHIKGVGRVVVVSGYIMAIAGFTMVYTVLAIIIVSYAAPAFGYLDQAQVATLLGLVSDLSYVLIVLAIIPTGIIIWVNSLIAFWKRKSLMNGGIAAWNTFATVRNVISASRNLPSALGRIGDTLRRQRGNSAIVILAVVIVLFAILGGYFTASAIMKRADKRYDLFSQVTGGRPLAQGAGEQYNPGGQYGPGQYGQGQYGPGQYGQGQYGPATQSEPAQRQLPY